MDQEQERLEKPQYFFKWGGIGFTHKSGVFEGARSAVLAGPGWSARVSVDGWLWKAWLTVNGGSAQGEGPTPWQALDAALIAWKDIVAALAKSFDGGDSQGPAV